ncbi:MAG: HPr family phosphocarrier protein [Bacillota bacterium]
MKKQTVVIQNETGLHARPASMLVDMAGNYESSINLVYDGQEVNAKSIMGVMSLGISHEGEVVIEATGPDEEEAVQSIVELIESGFGE